MARHRDPAPGHVAGPAQRAWDARPQLVAAIRCIARVGFCARCDSVWRRISSASAYSSPKRTSRRLFAMTNTYATAW